MSRPFLLLTTRDDEVVAADEFANLPRLGDMRPGEAVRLRLEREPFPDLDVDDWSGIIVCGSPFDASAPEERKSELQRGIEAGVHGLLDQVLDRDTPYLGLCYGLGLLTLHLGGRMDTEHGEEISGPLLEVTPEGRGDPLLDGVPGRFHGYVGHHEAATDVAPGAALLVTNAHTPVQLIRVGRHVYGSQFHPELDLAGIQVRISEYADRGYYPPEERSRIEQGVASVDVAPAHRVLRNFVRLFRR